MKVDIFGDSANGTLDKVPVRERLDLTKSFYSKNCPFSGQLQ